MYPASDILTTAKQLARLYYFYYGCDKSLINKFG